jgi:hypothetical protein
MRQCSCRFISTRRQAESTAGAAGLQVRPLTPRSEQAISGMAPSREGPRQRLSSFHSIQHGRSRTSKNSNKTIEVLSCLHVRHPGSCVGSMLENV